MSHSTDSVGIKRKVQVPLGALLLAIIFFLVALGLVTYGLISYEHEQDHRWCSLLTSIDYPRTTPAGDKFREALLDREQSLGCK